MCKKLLSVALVVILSACSTLQKELNHYIQKPTVSYKSMAVGDISMQEIKLSPTFSVANKNNFALAINSVSYELFLNNKKMLAGESAEIGALPAQAEKDITLSVVLNQETMASLQQLLFKHKKLDYKIQGKVATMGLTIPFESAATLYVPEIKVADLTVERATFTQLNITLIVEIENQNRFTLPLNDIHYSLSSQGKRLFQGELQNQKIVQGKNNLQLPLTIRPNELFNNLFALLLNPELPLTFTIESPLFSKSYQKSLNLTSFFL